MLGFFLYFPFTNNKGPKWITFTITINYNMTNTATWNSKIDFVQTDFSQSAWTGYTQNIANIKNEFARNLSA